jgi:hypothetical protein
VHITARIALSAVKDIAIVNGVFGLQGFSACFFQDEGVFQIFIGVLASVTTAPRDEVIVARNCVRGSGWLGTHGILVEYALVNPFLVIIEHLGTGIAKAVFAAKCKQIRVGC